MRMDPQGTAKEIGDARGTIVYLILYVRSDYLKLPLLAVRNDF